MEGPTPVSALIHAATMVTAGVFLICRCSFIFEYSQLTLNIMMFVGSITAFFASTTGLFQNDIKKVIAYSTCSQLGYMIFACGLSNYDVSLFHLSNHAFFKALLFLGAGSIIHAVSDEQDMRKMGSLKRIIPFTFAVIFIGSLALMGFPFLAGFYSKDVILEIAYSKYNFISHFAYWFGTIGAFFTAFYSIRLIFLVFLSETNGFRPVIIGAHDSPILISFPLFVLAFPSIFVGFLTKDFFIGFGSNFWQNSLFVLPFNLNIVDAEFQIVFYKVLPVILSLTGAFLAYFMYSFFSSILFDIKSSFVGRLLYVFLSKKWFFDKIYNEVFNQFLLNFSFHVSYKMIDRGIIQLLGPLSLSKNTKTIYTFLISLQTGNLYQYVTWLFCSFFFFLFFNCIFSSSLENFSEFLLFCFALFFKKTIKRGT